MSETLVMTEMEQNDLLRTKLKGGEILFTPSVIETFPAHLRGRLICRLTLYNAFHPDDDKHDEGVFVFAGYNIHWQIGEFAGKRSLTLSLASEW